MELGRHRRTRALHGAWLALLLLCGSLLGHLHTSTVRHARCAEHGELVHAEAHSAAPARTDEAAAPVRFEAAQPAEGGHEHCFVAVFRREAEARSVQAPACSAALDATPRRALDAPERVPAAFELYLLAPKHSPPA